MSSNLVGPGRPKGSLNKRTAQYVEVLEKNNFCIASTHMELYKIAMSQFTHQLEGLQSGALSPMESEASKYLKLCVELVADMASYSLPKLKSVEQQKSDAFEGMTPKERLEAMKHATAMYELQIKNDGPGGA